MLKNERGFTYPITLISLVLFTSYLAYFSEFYLSEKRLVSSATTIKYQEYYFHSSCKIIEERLMAGRLEEKGTLTYRFGEIYYEIAEEVDDLIEIQLTTNLTSEKTWMCMAYYDKVTGKLIKWQERG